MESFREKNTPRKRKTAEFAASTVEMTTKTIRIFIKLKEISKTV